MQFGATHHVLRMNLPRANLSLTMAGCALVVATAGCLAPWSPPISKGEGSHSPVAIGASPTNMAAPISQNGGAPAATDMAGVMDTLAHVREMDPAAEQKLLDELRRTPPGSWPLVSEQFRASLAYHQQLAAKPLKLEQVSEPMADFRRAPPTGTAVSAPRSISGDGAQRSLATDTGRPSNAIGALVDPHSAGYDNESVLVQSTPFAMPRPMDGELTSSPSDGPAPAVFTGSNPMYPIGAQGGAANERAAFEAPASDAVHVATQAIAKVESRGSTGQLQSSPPSAIADDNWQTQVQKAVEDLSRRVTESPTTTAEVHQHVSLRLLRLLAGDTEKALEPIPHIPHAEQDYWSRQIFALATYLDHHSQPDDKRRAAASVAHLDEAVSNLRELGSLSLRNLSFCKNVYGYGAFEPYERDIFAPGQQVSLYVEVENYHSASSEKGYCTLLGATYELVDDKGKRVSGGEFPDVDDCCRSRRRDFHIQFGLALPQNLTPGRYRVELVVKDRQSDKLGHATAPFEIRSDRK